MYFTLLKISYFPILSSTLSSKTFHLTFACTFLIPCIVFWTMCDHTGTSFLICNNSQASCRSSQSQRDATHISPLLYFFIPLPHRTHIWLRIETLTEHSNESICYGIDRIYLFFMPNSHAQNKPECKTVFDVGFSLINYVPFTFQKKNTFH